MVNRTPGKTTRKSAPSHSENDDETGTWCFESGRTESVATTYHPVQMQLVTKRNKKTALPPEPEKDAVFLQNFLKFQRYLALYDALKPEKKLTKVLYRQRTLSYMVHRQRDYKNGKEPSNNLKDDKENIKQSSQNPAIEIVLQIINPIQGFKYANVNWFIIKQKKNNIGRPNEPRNRSGEKDWLATSFFEFNKKNPCSDPVPVAASKLSQFDDDFKYSLGFIIKYANQFDGLPTSIHSTNTNQRHQRTQGALFFSGSVEAFEPLLTGEITVKIYPQDQPEASSPYRQNNPTPLNDGEFNIPSQYSGHSQLETMLQDRRESQAQYSITFRINDKTKPSSRPSISSVSSQSITRKVLKETQNTLLNKFSPAISYYQVPEERIKVRIYGDMLHRSLALTNYVCPICEVDCHNFKTLTIHLKTCHDRFSYKAEESPDKIIRISINIDFDGSFELDPRNNSALLINQKCPSQREGFCVLVSNELRNYQANFNQVWNTNFDLLEVLKYSNERMASDNRTYYHSQTITPIMPHEIDIDSEDDIYSEYTDWNQNRNIALIDEFTDVNPGEKEITKMWNIHLMKNSRIAMGECHIGNVAKLFVKKHANEIIEKNLKMNLVLHLCNLHSFGFVKAKDIKQLCMKMNEFEKKKFANKEAKSANS